MVAYSPDYGPGGFLLLIILIGLYLLPTILAVSRKVPNAGSVFVINFLLGWSLIGWVVALAMASRSVPAVQSQNVYVQSSIPVSQTPPGLTFTHTGQRYLFGFTLDPASYAIWDRQQQGAPIERFPYNEHGKTEGLSRYRALEPNAAEVGPGPTLPPMPR